MENKEPSDERKDMGEMLTVEEVARFKAVTPDSVRKAIRGQRLAATKRWGMYFVRPLDAERWRPIGHRPRKDGSSSEWRRRCE